MYSFKDIVSTLYFISVFTLQKMKISKILYFKETKIFDKYNLNIIH